jgi:transcription-repair coupling factor (superfamily II helicase)
MSVQKLSVIYECPDGKSVRLTRASGYIEKSKTIDVQNQKALANLSAETLLPRVDINFDSSWQYIATESIDDRWCHHFEKAAELPMLSEHVWLVDPNIKSSVVERESVDAA